MPFQLRRAPLRDIVMRPVRLTSRELVAPNFVRLRFEGEDLQDFESPGADDHVRLFFPEGDLPTSLDAWRSCPSREYTPLAWNTGERWIDIEFLVHGEHGVAGRWARHAPLGSEVGVAGPRGSQVIDGTPDHWILIGDETAVPAIRRLLDVAGPQAHGRVVVEVADAAHEIPVATGPDVTVEYVHRGDRPAAESLAERVAALATEPSPGGDVFCFVAAESGIVRPGRRLLDAWGIDPDDAVVKGYWKQGETEYHAPH